MSEIPFPVPASKKAKTPQPTEAFVPERPSGPAPLTISGFFAEHRALVDGRKAHLERLGMMPQHVTALKMPDLGDTPMLAPSVTETLPEVNVMAAEFETPKLPKLLGVNATLDE